MNPGSNASYYSDYFFVEEELIKKKHSIVLDKYFGEVDIRLNFHITC